MSFPDYEALIRCGKVWKFRPPQDDESEASYRVALADFVQSKDLVESMEIRTGHSWNVFTNEENVDLLRRSGQRDL